MQVNKQTNYRFYSLISIFQNLGQRIIFSFVQLYADSVGATASQQGWLLSFRNIISFSGQQIFGRASDRYGRVIVLIFGFVLASITSVFFIKINTPLLIIIVFAFYSLGFSAIQPSFNALIGDTYTHNDRTQMLGAITSIGGLFGGLSFLVAGLYGDQYENPYGVLFLISAISFIFAALSVLILKIKHNVPTQIKIKNKNLNLFEPLKTDFFRKFVFTDALFGFAMATSWPLFPKRTNELATTSQVTIMWAMVFILFSISAKYTHIIKQRIGRYNVSFYVSRALLWLVPLSFAFATNWTHLLLARMIAGLTFGYYSTLQKDYILETVKKINKIENRGWYLGTHAFIFGISTFLGSLIFGDLAEFLLNNFNFTYSQLFLISATIRFVFVFIYLRIPNI